MSLLSKMEHQKEKSTTSSLRTRDLYLLDSECLNSWLHRYDITQEWEDCVEETCLICGDQQFFKVINGSIDNLAYLDRHARLVLLPSHPLYEREYPKR